MMKMTKKEIENFILGFNARVEGIKKPNRTHACSDGYSCANTLFSKETALIIKEARLPNYPEKIDLSSKIKLLIDTASDWHAELDLMMATGYWS